MPISVFPYWNKTLLCWIKLFPYWNKNGKLPSAISKMQTAIANSPQLTEKMHSKGCVLESLVADFKNLEILQRMKCNVFPYIYY